MKELCSKNIYTPQSCGTWASLGSLPTRIQISHHDMKHLAGLSSIALGTRRPPGAIDVGNVVISIRPRDCWQPGASATNEPCALRNGKARLESPIGNLSHGRARGSQRGQAFEFQCVGHDGFQYSARGAQRQVVIALFDGAPAIYVGLLDNRPQLQAVDELEPPGWWRRR